MLGVGVMAAPARPRALAGAGRDLDPRRAAAVDLALRRRAARQPRHRPGRGAARRRAPRRRRACCWCSSPCWSARRWPPPSGGAWWPALGLAALVALVLTGSAIAPDGSLGGQRRGRARPGRRPSRGPARPTPASSTCSSAMSPRRSSWSHRSISSSGPRTSSTPTRPSRTIRGPTVVGDLATRPRRADDRRHGRGSRPERLSQRGGAHRRRRRDHRALRQGPPRALRRVRAAARRCWSRSPATRCPTATP